MLSSNHYVKHVILPGEVFGDRGCSQIPLDGKMIAREPAEILIINAEHWEDSCGLAKSGGDQEVTRFLASLPYFRRWYPSEVAMLAGRVEVVKCCRNSEIISQGGLSSDVLFIQSGQVAVRRTCARTEPIKEVALAELRKVREVSEGEERAELPPGSLLTHLDKTYGVCVKCGRTGSLCCTICTFQPRPGKPCRHNQGSLACHHCCFIRIRDMREAKAPVRTTLPLSVALLGPGEVLTDLTLASAELDLAKMDPRTLARSTDLEPQHQFSVIATSEVAVIKVKRHLLLRYCFEHKHRSTLRLLAEQDILSTRQHIRNANIVLDARGKYLGSLDDIGPEESEDEYDPPPVEPVPESNEADEEDEDSVFVKTPPAPIIFCPIHGSSPSKSYIMRMGGILGKCQCPPPAPLPSPRPHVDLPPTDNLMIRERLPNVLSQTSVGAESTGQSDRSSLTPRFGDLLGLAPWKQRRLTPRPPYSRVHSHLTPRRSPRTTQPKRASAMSALSMDGSGYVVARPRDEPESPGLSPGWQRGPRHDLPVPRSLFDASDTLDRGWQERPATLAEAAASHVFFESMEGLMPM